ncbi:cobW-domain-containing protein [Gymnopus androsaceus JB14]|uniref:CobW-domain-containing protein n=1 Tax=Gymnopus androsaceus JB14 TaxID=1447944 RepID=A0A6A4HZJ3_9AGAR|nr:cobW-domain-containing protein [Gymnopus androsaceus JB14]
MSKKATIPITVFTGFLGAGKTSVILSLLPKLPKDYKVVLLKNEYVSNWHQVDSKLAKESSLMAVSEILNGCMCCVLVGQMQNALLEIRDQYHPDRIIIECSGSAFPATLAFQIREMERNTDGDFKLDSIITVIDAENFTGYEDTSPTAKMQASYTDIILINKWENVSERQLDIVMDHLHTLNDLTPKIRCDGRDGIDPNLIFGIESTLFLDESTVQIQDPSHVDEVQTLTLYRGSTPIRLRDGDPHHSHEHPHTHTHDHEHISASNTLIDCLTKIGKESVWRVKGFIRVREADNDTENIKVYILNWAFGRYELTRTDAISALEHDCSVKLTVMGERGELRRAIGPFCRGLELLIL